MIAFSDQHLLESGDVCVGVISAAFGVKGLVKIKCFTDTPYDIGAFQMVFDPVTRRSFLIEVVSVKKDFAFAKIAGVSSRTEAEKLQNTKLCIYRSELPKTQEEEYYHTDLLGCSVYYDDGLYLGQVIAVHNFGAGDVVEVYDSATSREAFYPFNKEFIQEVDISTKRIQIMRFSEVVATTDEE